MVKKMGARKTVVAVPTAPLRSLEKVETGVEEIYCANIRQSIEMSILKPTKLTAKKYRNLKISLEERQRCSILWINEITKERFMNRTLLTNWAEAPTL
jgi:hypothetical protein